MEHGGDTVHLQQCNVQVILFSPVLWPLLLGPSTLPNSSDSCSAVVPGGSLSRMGCSFSCSRSGDSRRRGSGSSRRGGGG